jgi:predicted RNA-binding protein associated with RNAse of E/G family
MTQITIVKHDHHGRHKWEYSGAVVDRGPTWVCIRAPFSGEYNNQGVVIFRRGDLFTEWHYSDRWYNVFRVQAADGQLKGWFCNATRPAVITESRVVAEDLALDVFVMPDGTIHMLDEDEFAALNLSPDEHAAALNAIETIRQLVAARAAPFDEIRS